ncbi:hypothetical protein CIPAW_09G200600 [Carya illinoinensis]|uniref:Uncharacterized protein n=1 Tax=Carya illinoinensis TaxID=32201 RepID=A0A8T1PNJ1_CARIL|nr:hypothetical protein CIPAW_09G200600 [Carya illinoinensis]
MPYTSAAEKHKAPDAASSQAAASPPHPADQTTLENWEIHL